MVVMKNRKLNSIILLSFMIMLSAPVITVAQTKITPNVQLTYYKDTREIRILQATVTYSNGTTEVPLTGIEVEFFKGSAPKELIAKSVTDKKGIARLELNPDLKVTTDEAGMWGFSSEYIGCDTIEAATSEVSVKDVSLFMDLSEVDSIKTVTVKAFILEKGIEKPVSGEIVKVYAPRMFAPLLIGNITLDESGKGTVEFPNDLPGNKEGVLSIAARFEDNGIYGNVEKRSEMKWGTPMEEPDTVTHRALWTKTAPRWMIYTLSVLLAGVWGHYMFAIISLIRIKRDATRKAKEEYRV
jgi:hypothetical protein